MNCTGGFKFGNMFFKFEYENDDTMDVAELFIEGKSEQAKKALEFALRYLKSNLDEVTSEMVNSFWEGDELNDSQIEEQIDQCINQFKE